MEKTQKALDELFAALKEEMPSDTTAVSIFFNSNGCEEFGIRKSSAESLNARGVSMRNLRGTFIS